MKSTFRNFILCYVMMNIAKCVLNFIYGMCDFIIIGKKIYRNWIKSKVKNTFGDIHHYITNNQVSKSRFNKNMFLSPFLKMMDIMRFYQNFEISQFL